MITVNSFVNTLANLLALQQAAKVTFGAAYIDCNQTQYGVAWTVYLSQAVAGQQSLWDNLINIQDPVYIYCDKTQIKADDTDRCTITVTAPKAGAAPVVLSIAVNSGVPVDLPIALTGGVGGDYFTAKDPGTITIILKNGANRNIDTLVVKAV